MADVFNKEESSFGDPRVVAINRTAKVVKGGRRFSFAALVVLGDGEGTVGVALGKAREVPDAIRKGSEAARKRTIKVPLHNTTIPHEVMGRFGSSRVVLIPAAPGTGVIAGSTVRAIMEQLGVRDILTKCHGTSNPHNVTKATLDGLKQLRSHEEIARRRGKSLEEITGRKAAPASDNA
ncbi:MAG: 30S ribosomal protein S5 [Myxococcota bacterium]|nr:30S ribosomal protein S5 [Myxococcota bacterium]